MLLMYGPVLSGNISQIEAIQIIKHLLRLVADSETGTFKPVSVDWGTSGHLTWRRVSYIIS
jgi:hypothetical protein